MSFWKELSRRNVVKVGVAYAVAAWLIIHPVDIIFPILHLPDWSITLVAAILIIIFPLVLIFSWIYEVTPKGLKRTKEVPASKSITHQTGKRLNYIITGLLVIAVAYLLFDKYFISNGAVKTKQAPAVTETAKTQKTIAVLPFEDLSPKKDQEYFVDGLSEEILNSLAQIPDLNVTGRTSSFTFKGSNKKTPEIANELGVENILEGSVRKAGNELRITAQLLRGKDGFHLWSQTYDRKLKDIFAVQEDIAKAIANELKATLGIGKSLKQLGSTDNVEAYEYYLIAQGIRREETVSAFNKALESIDKAIALDPKFALAWVYKGGIHLALAANAPFPRLISPEYDAAYQATMRAIELEPNLAEAYTLLGDYRFISGDFIAAELAYRKAIELTSSQLSYTGTKQYNRENILNVAWAEYLLSVGYFEKAHQYIETTLLYDPLILPIRAFYVMSFGIRGDMQRAKQEDERCLALFGDQWNLENWSITFLRLGTGEILSRDEIKYSELIFDAAKEHLDSPKEGLAALHRIYTKNDDLTNANLANISVWAAYFGDPEFAMDAQEKAFSIVASKDADSVFSIWYPVMKKVRQTPRFKAFVKKIGLVDYWNKFGWPDICHKLDNGDFVCD